uniref:Envelope polyprotein n=1 Tax=Seriola dumerili TaxID=41447 RepID=A0A3B4VQN1_SERDU
MTPNGLRNAILGWMVTLFLIVTFLFVWYLWEPPKEGLTRNRTPNITQQNTTHERNKRSTDSECGEDIQTKHTGLVFCSPQNQTTAIIIPYGSLINNAGSKGQSWGETYNWYATIGTGWGSLIGETGHDWSSWSLDSAAETRKKFSISKNSQGLVLSYNTATTVCLTVSLWAHSSGRDPQFKVALCYKDQPKPSMPSRTQQKGGRIVVISNRAGVVDTWFQVTTGISGQSNNWLLMVEQAANMSKKDCVVCMGPRPLLQIIPATIPRQCVVEVMNKTNPNTTCSSWESVFPITKNALKKPMFSKRVAQGNFTCINMTGDGRPLGNLSKIWCAGKIIAVNNLNPVSRGDIWWWCGDDRIFDKLPKNATGLCALVTLLIPVSFVKQIKQWHLQKRTATWQNDDDPTYIDAIGVPRGVPDEYKLVDQVAVGFESLLYRINYIHYNVQKLGNWTEVGFEAVHGQLAATSFMTFQTRIAVDMLLAEKGGVCAMFGEQCCTFIPNNTAPDGSLTKAIEGLKTLNGKMKEHSGVDTTMWDSWMNAFGKYRTLVSSVLVSIAVFAAVLTLCGCCCIPCIRSLLNRLITTPISPMENQIAQMYPLLGKGHDSDSDSENEDSETTY